MPGQVLPVIAGVTVMVLVSGAEVAFVVVKVGTFPVPEAAKPMPVLELVHVYVAPAGVLVKAVAGTLDPGQYVLLTGTVTVGLGVTAHTIDIVIGE